MEPHVRVCLLNGEENLFTRENWEVEHVLITSQNHFAVELQYAVVWGSAQLENQSTSHNNYPVISFNGSLFLGTLMATRP